MVTISSIPTLTAIDGDEEEESLMEWVDDHERKLFWALFLPNFHPQINAADFRQFQDLARHIHETRLSTLYVDPRLTGEVPIEISDEQLGQHGRFVKTSMLSL